MWAPNRTQVAPTFSGRFSSSHRANSHKKKLNCEIGICHALKRFCAHSAGPTRCTHLERCPPYPPPPRSASAAMSTRYAPIAVASSCRAVTSERASRERVPSRMVTNAEATTRRASGPRSPLLGWSSPRSSPRPQGTSRTSPSARSSRRSAPGACRARRERTPPSPTTEPCPPPNLGWCPLGDCTPPSGASRLGLGPAPSR